MVLFAPDRLPERDEEIRKPEAELERRQGWLNWWLDYGQPVSPTYHRVREERERLHRLLGQRGVDDVLEGTEPPF